MLKLSNESNQIPMRKETGSEAANEENGLELMKDTNPKIQKI